MKMTFSTLFRVAASTDGAMMGYCNGRGSNEGGIQREGRQYKTQFIYSDKKEDKQDKMKAFDVGKEKSRNETKACQLSTPVTKVCHSSCLEICMGTGPFRTRPGGPCSAARVTRLPNARLRCRGSCTLPLQ